MNHTSQPKNTNVQFILIDTHTMGDDDTIIPKHTVAVIK